MVDRLVQATAHCMTLHGLDGFTTHQVADEAGVSVGSLYQYFESREDLVQALMDKVMSQLVHGLNTQVLGKTTDLREVVELAVRFGFAFLRADDGLGLEMVRNWHRLPTQNVVRLLQDVLMDFMRLYLLKNPTHRQPQRLQVRGFIVANSVVFTMIRAISEPSPFLNEDDLAQELVQMVVAYLET